MRCVHCGKEVRNNVIFCIHCGRPVKHRYSHYACEYYGGLSVWDKIQNLFNEILTKDKVYRQDVSLKRTKVNNINIKDTIKKKGNSIAELYNKYGGETSEQNNKETEKENNNQDSENFSVKDITKIKDFAQKTAKDFSGSTGGLKENKIKMFVVVLLVGLSSLGGIINLFTDDYNYDDANEVYYDADEETSYYEFPENPVINSELVESIDSCPLGSGSLIIDYLSMVYEDIDEMQNYNDPIHSFDEFEPYVSEIEKIEADYNNNENYFVYDRLIAIKKLWIDLILPIYQDPDSYDQQQIDERLNQFSTEFNDVSSYYVSDEYF